MRSENLNSSLSTCICCFSEYLFICVFGGSRKEFSRRERKKGLPLMCSFSNCQHQLGEAWAEEESADSKQVSHISGWDSITSAITSVDSLPGFSLAASQSLGAEPASKAKHSTFNDGVFAIRWNICPFLTKQVI